MQMLKSKHWCVIIKYDLCDAIGVVRQVIMRTVKEEHATRAVSDVYRIARESGLAAFCHSAYPKREMSVPDWHPPLKTYLQRP